jgi:hypothetical protein
MKLSAIRSFLTCKREGERERERERERGKHQCKTGYNRECTFESFVDGIIMPGIFIATGLS